MDPGSPLPEATLMRSRLLHPEFAQHEGLGDLSHTHRLLFAMLPMLADREGRLEDRPRRIKASLFPYDPDDIVGMDGLLSDLAQGGFITRYVVDDRAYICIPGFRNWQKPHPRESASELPGPNQGEPKANLGLTLYEPRRPVSVSVSVSDPVSVQEQEIPASPPAPAPAGQAGLVLAPDVDVIPKTRAIEDRVFAHWVKARGKRNGAKLSPERRKKIAQRLKDGFSEQQLCQAIDGVARDSWEDRPKHDDLVVILRDASHVEKFIDLATQFRARPQPASDEQVSARSAAEAERDALRAQLIAAAEAKKAARAAMPAAEREALEAAEKAAREAKYAALRAGTWSEKAAQVPA
jgi:hypothetical protein